MYIWVAINVDSQFAEVKERASMAEKQVGFRNTNVNLPLHVSLKISFSVEDKIYLNVVDRISDYYSRLSPFDIEVAGMEKNGGILWIKMKENHTLKKIHIEMDDLLKAEYGVGLHEYDLAYQFHTTIFMEEDKNIIDKAYELMKDVSLPPKLSADTFVVGISESGKIGTYRVYKTVTL